MKQIIFIGLVLLSFSNLVTGIHLRHESMEQRRKEGKEEAKKEINTLLTETNYEHFVNKLKNSLSTPLPEVKKNKETKTEVPDRTFHTEFKEALREIMETKDNGVIINKSNQNDINIEDKYKKVWWDNDILEKLGLDKTLIAIPVRDLRATQSEIGLQNSLDFAISQEDAKQYYGEEPKIIGAPILTYKSRFVLDGHHRWSQLYMLNRDAKIYAYNLVPKEDNNEKNEKKDKEEAIELLRKLQLTIGAYFGTIPTSSGEGTVNVYNNAKIKSTTIKENGKEVIIKIADVDPDLDLYFSCRFRNSPKDEDDNENVKGKACKTLLDKKKEKTIKNDVKRKRKIDYNHEFATKGFIESYKELFKVNTGNNVRENVMEQIKFNVKRFVAETIDSDKKPSRDLMPQTDGPGNFLTNAIIDENDKKDLIIIKGEKGEKDEIKSLPAIIYRLIKPQKNEKITPKQIN